MVLPHLLQHLPRRFGRYHEPMIGGGAFFFELVRSRKLKGGARVADLNPRLVRTWLAVQNEIEPLIARLQEHAAHSTEEYYYDQRKRMIDDEASDVEVAAWFIYLNKTGFNGLYRVNSKNIVNVPWGRFKNPAICDERNLRGAHEALQGVEISLGEVDLVEEKAVKGDLVYFDPPYVPLSKSSSFTAYTKVGFNMDAQARLRDLALRLKKRGVHVLLSNHDTEEIRALYEDGFHRETIQVKRNINSVGTKRGAVDEVLIW